MPLFHNDRAGSQLTVPLLGSTSGVIVREWTLNGPLVASSRRIVSDGMAGSQQLVAPIITAARAYSSQLRLTILAAFRREGAVGADFPAVVRSAVLHLHLSSGRRRQPRG